MSRSIYSRQLKRGILAVALTTLLGGAFAFSAAGIAQEHGNSAEADCRRLPVAAPFDIETPACVEAAGEIDILAGDAGVVRAATFPEVAQVRSGQALREARMALESAIAKARHAQATADRAMRLVHRESVSKQELERRRRAATASRAGEASARSAFVRLRKGAHGVRAVAAVDGRMERADFLYLPARD